MSHKINFDFGVSVDGQSFRAGTRSFTVNTYDSVDHTVDALETIDGGPDEPGTADLTEVLPDVPEQVQVFVLLASTYGDQLEFALGEASSRDSEEFEPLTEPLFLLGDQFARRVADDGTDQDVLITNSLESEVRIRVLVGRDSSATP